ncbi:Protein of unknown function [Cotesia congregata]|uniref:Uncharacterized protein n=1 Tax=Cotesia congregata TaxID=51543 RepID=A0A8J2HMF5_COTCN|nr:Protein of unknown function [Cotesia congregata]
MTITVSFDIHGNVTAADGTRPIHLACFYERHRKVIGINSTLTYDGIIRTLVQANANTDADALESAHDEVYMKYIEKLFKDPTKLINHCDNDGVPATHYLFHPKQYGNCRYFGPETFHIINPRTSKFIYNLILYGADIYALINNDPATFLPNLTAYKSCSGLLKAILPYYTDMSLSRVLYYATLPIDENSDDLYRPHPTDYVERSRYLAKIRIRRQESIQVAIEDLVLRRSLRLFVPDEEMKLMDKLIATDENIRRIVNDYKINFIEKELKNVFIKLSGKELTIHDLLMQIYDNKKLMILARDKSFQRVWSESTYLIRHWDFKLLYMSSKLRINRFNVREAIPLPYELILDIVEYLNNEELDIFISAFYNSYLLTY